MNKNVTFKYQGKVYTTPNLEKKLKRMSITKQDIEILPTLEKEIVKESEEWRHKGSLLHYDFHDPDTGDVYCFQAPPGVTREELFQHLIYDGTFGVKGVTKELVDRLELRIREN